LYLTGAEIRMAEKLELGDHIKNNPLLLKSFLLALEIIKLYQFLTQEKYEYIMLKQLKTR